MRTLPVTLMLGALVLAAAFSVAPARAEEGEKKIDIKDLPSGGLEAVKQLFPHADIIGASKEKEGDATVYEVELKQKDKGIDVTLDEQGAVKTIEKEITAKDLPGAAAKAIAAKYGKSGWKKIEEVTQVKEGKKKLDFYELLIKVSEKKAVEVKVTPEGKLSEEDSDGDEER